MTKYTIEKNIPIPTEAGATRASYPFHQMEVGDSFTAPVSERARINNAICGHKKRHGAVFSVRTLGDGTVRVWRIK